MSAAIAYLTGSIAAQMVKTSCRAVVVCMDGTAAAMAAHMQSVHLRLLQQQCIVSAALHSVQG